MHSGPLDIIELKQVEVHGLTRWEGVPRRAPDLHGAQPTIRAMIAHETDAWQVERLVVE